VNKMSIWKSIVEFIKSRIVEEEEKEEYRSRDFT